MEKNWVNGKESIKQSQKNTEGYRDKESHVSHSNRTASRKESNNRGAN